MGTMRRNYGVEPLRQMDEAHYPYGHPQANLSSSLGKWFCRTESRTMYPTELINYFPRSSVGTRISECHIHEVELRRCNAYERCRSIGRFAV